MENLLGFASSGAGLLVVFALYLGGAGMVLKLADRLVPRKRGE
jgi:hypothetical protein